jgi:WD40 repeat protein
MIAYITKEKEAPNISYMNVVNIENRVVRIVGKISSAYVNTELAWSPDSKRIAFNDEKGNIIKIMNLDDGGIEDIKTGLVDVNIYHLDWSPDGKQFVFGGWKGGNAEFWFMEDFLPLEKLAQKGQTETRK